MEREEGAGHDLVIGIATDPELEGVDKTKRMDFELTDDQKTVQRLAKVFTDREIEPIAVQIERDAKIPSDMHRKMARAGLLGVTTAEDYGGSGQGFLAGILALEQVHYPCTPCTWLAASGGVTEVYEEFGTEEQKREYIPQIIRAEGCPSSGFTEPASGLDPKMLTTTAVLERGYWVINGVKRFCTFGSYNGPSIVYCRTDGDRISAIVVPKNCAGYSCSTPWELMGLRGLDSVDVFLHDVRVPETNLLGERAGGHLIVKKIMESGGVTCGIISVACGQRALDEAVKYAKQRRTRGGTISDMQGHRWLFAEMACRVEAARSLTYRTACMREQGRSTRKDSAMVKLYAAEVGEWVASQALRLQGAYGYTTEHRTERILRASIAMEVMEATNEVQKTIIGADLFRD